MKKALRIIALVLVVAAVALWAETGTNRGWTKTTKPRGTLDEVTGLVDQTPEKTFIPGVDFLGAALLGAAILTGVSFVFRSKLSSSINQIKP